MERVEELVALLEEWECKRKCRKRELLSLIGKLSHACKIVRLGRIFLRHMINQSMKAKRLDHWLYLSAEFRADVGWWQAFLQAWNHRSMMQLSGRRSPEVVFASGASGGWGCGAVWEAEWLQWQWEDDWVQQQIAVKELVLIVAACAVWGPQWANKSVLVKCDNMAVV